MPLIEKIAETLEDAPVPKIILFFGGLFIIASITTNGAYIFESFITFIYGIISSYIRIIRHKEDKNLKDYRIYFIIQGIIFLIWLFFIIKNINIPNIGISNRFNI